MILVGQYDSPYVRRVAVSLHALGLDFERNTMSVFADADAMRRINPLGRIPALILDGGETLIDSAAILDHLDEMVGRSRALLPASGADRRRALQIIALATGCIDKVGAIAYEQTLRPAEKVHAPWIDRCRAQLESGIAALESWTGPGWYLGGDRPMQPDIAAGCMIGYLRLRAPDAFPAGAYPRLEHLSASCEATPWFRAATAAADETMPSAPL
ncbi:MAG TPA: glutathione S-transferase family protein [Candidatus Acidoferrum sp.]|nr:glutathione S-transferase family protein [Candidatus Acidoferrum sp.]